MCDIIFWRQFLILSTNLLSSLSIGFAVAFPAVLSPAITSPNSTDIKTTGDHASWIASIGGVGGVFGTILLSPIMQILGRKASNYGMNACVLVGWIMIPLAKNVATLYMARFIQGFSIIGTYINAITISEYVHPSRRGYFITLMKVLLALGILCCHSMGAFWSWREIGIFAAVPSLLSIILTFFWPESPSYLALKGRFSECEKSFKWLNGNSDESKKHLQSLVEAQTKKALKNKRKIISLMELWKTFLKKDFQKALLMNVVLILSLDVCGKYYLQVYGIEIMMDLLHNKTSATYFTLGSDIVAIIALSLSSIVIRYAKRRTILFCTGSFVVFIMLLTSVLIYFKTVFTVSTYFLWLTASMIILQSLMINVGLIPLIAVLVGEIFPLENKGMGVFTSGFISSSLDAFNMKVTPVLMERTGLYGTYAIFGVFLAICLVVLFIILPETKDRILQDIQDELNDVHRKELDPLERETLTQSNENNKDMLLLAAPRGFNRLNNDEN